MTATETPFDDIPLAVFSRRKPGDLVTAEIEGGDPPLTVRFKVPGPDDAALIEARVREAVVSLVSGRGSERRYGLTPGANLDEATLSALAPFITAVESATVLLVDWNLALPDADGNPVKVTLEPEAIAEAFRGRPMARAGWNLQHEAVSPWDRAEGKG